MFTKHKTLLCCLLLQMVLINADDADKVLNPLRYSEYGRRALAAIESRRDAGQIDISSIQRYSHGSCALSESRECSNVNGLCLPSSWAVILGTCYGGCSDGCGCFFSTKRPKCSTICTMEFKPVCGTDGRTYSNECSLIVAACQRDCTIRKAYDGECRQRNCDILCAQYYDPVCGTDGKTYGNSCMLNVASCRSGGTISLAYDGECRTRSGPVQFQPGCDRMCTHDITPVCGTDGNTYQNLCKLELAACWRGDKSLKKDHDGECGSLMNM